MVLPRQTGTRSAPGGSRTAGPARPVGQPGYPSGWPPASAPVACHAARVEDGGSERQGRGKRTFAPTFGPLEFCGRLKDLLGEQIHATRNPGRTREQIAEILGTTAREVEKKVGGASHRPALHEVPAFVSVLGDERQWTASLAALASARGFIRNWLKHHLDLRVTPELASPRTRPSASRRPAWPRCGPTRSSC